MTQNYTISGVEIPGLAEKPQNCAIINDFLRFFREKVPFDRHVDIIFDSDPENGDNLLGRTAFYSPQAARIVVFVNNRHFKDIIRSLSHELIHHIQAERGDLGSHDTPEGYAQSDPHLRSLEKEAYLKGNMIFRDWEDEYKKKNKKINELYTLTVDGISHEVAEKADLFFLREGKPPDDLKLYIWESSEKVVNWPVGTLITLVDIEFGLEEGPWRLKRIIE
jgi:hypothetical protein